MKKALIWGLALAAVLGPGSRAAAALLRAPYLQSVSATSVVLMWQTDLASGGDSIVHYGSALASRDQSASGSATLSPTDAGLRNHAVVISGLTPGTRYYYDVGCTSTGVEAGGTAQHYFTTAPAAGASTAFSFWVLADAGTNGSTQRAVRDAMLAATAGDPPDLFLTAGDMAYDTGTNAQFTSNFFAVYADTLRHTPLWPALGNHEGSDGSSNAPTQSGPYFESFTLPRAGEAGGTASGTEAYYAFDHGNAHFVMLDSDDSSVAPGSAQLTWLATDLASVPASRQWLIAIFHHPPYSKGSHSSNSATDSGGRMIRMRENVLPILEAGGVDLVIAGHSHSYERSYLIRGAYGYGASPTFVTPPLSVLQTDGHVVNAGDGSPTGDGAYTKQAGTYPGGGTVYVVAGHGGAATSGPIDHPVMHFSELLAGSCLVTIDATVLRLQNVRASGVVSDAFSLVKPPLCSTANECADGSACTLDACSDGRCVHDARSCDDADACTADGCDAATGCVHGPVGCDDTDACTADACDPSTGCAHVVVSCDDSNACTADGCDSATGCAHLAVSCDDGDACTSDACDMVAGCSHAAVSCDDADACTADVCDAVSGCAHASVSCDDADACTTDACDAVSGCAHASVSCDDADACTADACDSLTGCVHHVLDCEPPDAAVEESEDAGHATELDAAAEPQVPDAGEPHAQVEAGIPSDAATPSPNARTDAATDAASTGTDGAAPAEAGIGPRHGSADCGCRIGVRSAARAHWTLWLLGALWLGYRPRASPRRPMP